MEENVEINIEKKEEAETKETNYTIGHLEDILGIPSDSIMFSFGK